MNAKGAVPPIAGEDNGGGISVKALAQMWAIPLSVGGCTG